MCWEKLKDPMAIASVLGGIAGGLLGLYYSRNLPLKQGALNTAVSLVLLAVLAPALISRFDLEWVPVISAIVVLMGKSVLDMITNFFSALRARPYKTVSDIVKIFISVVLAWKHGVQTEDKNDEHDPY